MRMRRVRKQLRGGTKMRWDCSISRSWQPWGRSAGPSLLSLRALGPLCEQPSSEFGEFGDFPVSVFPVYNVGSLDFGLEIDSSLMKIGRK